MTANKSSILHPADDAPDLSSPEWRAKAETALASRKAGRPFKAATERKVPTTIRFDPKLLEQLRALGTGWQTTVNSVLGEWIERRKN